jgi:hypothetical protein
MPWESKRDWAAVALGLVARVFSRMQVPARDVRTEPSARRAVLDGGERSFHVRYAGAASISLTTASWPSHGCRQCTSMQVRRATWWVPPSLPRALQSLERMSTSPCQERIVRPCKEQPLLPTSPRESRFPLAYSHPYARNVMTWRQSCTSKPRCTRSTNSTN